MTKKIIIFIIFVLIFFSLSAANILLIHNPPYSHKENENNIVKYFIEEIFTELQIETHYEYVSLEDAMKRIDNNDFFIATPYFKPRNMSNKILLSDTLCTLKHVAFYNENIYNKIKINELNDLQTYIVGSNAYYKYEPMLRKAGLTVHYSNNNIESQQKLTDQQIDFVIEEEIKGLIYLNQTTGKYKNNIKYQYLNSLNENIFLCAAKDNEKSVNLINQINSLLNNKDFIDKLKVKYINNFLK
ncbi:MAG: transporter substrate-binding domain-containing protein [Candidatus Cloacimonetes bacterium]|jgi:hypothetical protein|nr:transporter substrate-binding domain-containing protein [Candidatus Cloacimonadota bacterium]MDD4155600.1 transporter substrate-binding domain-containing protein [Candidatus Cloacimonadota bacterium]